MEKKTADKSKKEWMYRFMISLVLRGFGSKSMKQKIERAEACQLLLFKIPAC